MVQTYQIKML